MAKIAYIRCQRKQEIEDFEQKAQADSVFIDLADEYGITLSDSLQTMLEKLNNGDKVIIRSLHEAANDVFELRSFLTTLRKVGVDLVVLNTDRGAILSEAGYQMLSFVDEFMREKDKLKREKQSRHGRPVQPYPPNFLDVYTRYRNKEFNGLEAAKKLSVNYDKFRELVKVFELRI